MRDFTDKVVVITGAGSGIGLATARAFASEGSRVHLVDIDSQRVEEAARTTNRTESVAHVIDCTNPEEMNTLARDVLSREDG